MITRSVQLSLLALVSAGVCQAAPKVVAKASEANKIATALAKRSSQKTYNLKSLERRIEAHAKRVAKRGEDATVSNAFKAVQEGMKKGNYHYDLETARAVAREVHAHRMPAAPSSLLASSGFRQ